MAPSTENLEILAALMAIVAQMNFVVVAIVWALRFRRGPRFPAARKKTLHGKGTLEQIETVPRGEVAREVRNITNVERINNNDGKGVAAGECAPVLFPEMYAEVQSLLVSGESGSSKKHRQRTDEQFMSLISSLFQKINNRLADIADRIGYEQDASA